MGYSDDQRLYQKLDRLSSVLSYSFPHQVFHSMRQNDMRLKESIQL